MSGRAIRRWTMSGVIVVALALCVLTPWPTDLLARPITHTETPQPADVIIVLGSGTRHGPDPLPTQARLRTDAGVALWRQGFADTVIFSGGLSKATSLIESDVMAQYAASIGLPDETIIRERASTSTRENAQRSLAIMADKKFDTAIVVTSSYHTWRACRVFRFLRAHITCVAATIHAAPEKLSDRIGNFISVVREYGAIAYYTTRQYI